MYNPYANPESHYNITPDDATDLTQASVIYIGGAGNLKVDCAKNRATVVYQNLDAGQWLPIKIIRVWSASTTCSGLIGAF